MRRSVQLHARVHVTSSHSPVHTTIWWALRSGRACNLCTGLYFVSTYTYVYWCSVPVLVCSLGFGRKEVVELLIEKGAKVDIQDDGRSCHRVEICVYVWSDLKRGGGGWAYNATWACTKYYTVHVHTLTDKFLIHTWRTQCTLCSIDHCCQLGSYWKSVRLPLTMYTACIKFHCFPVLCWLYVCCSICITWLLLVCCIAYFRIPLWLP